MPAPLATLPALPRSSHAEAKTAATATTQDTLRHLAGEAKAMAQDVWQTFSTPTKTLKVVGAEAQEVCSTLKKVPEYRKNILGRWFNQVGGGLSHGGFLALLSNTSGVSAAGAAGGVLASMAISYFEDRVAGMAQVHRGILRDLNRHDGTTPAESSAQIKSRAASRLLLLGAMDAGVMACALGVVWCVSGGLISSGGLLLALAVMQTVRTAIVIYQFACLDILKVQISDDRVRDIIDRKWTNAVNNTEQGLGRTIYQTTLIACQTASFLMPATYHLPFTAAQILVGMGLSAVGKLQFLPLIMVDRKSEAAPQARLKEA